jgi:serine/threonine protein kinase
MKIIHRDLKPENIFLVPTELIESGELVKILDFGIAKVYGDSQYTKITQAGFFLGSCAYASPEQLQSPDKVDERSDIYSLGMLLYRMLSGVDPFGLSESNGFVHYTAWCLAHLNTKAVPLASQPNCTTLDPRLTALVDRCLSKAPQDRFLSVDALLADLKAIGTPNVIPPAESEESGSQGSETQYSPVQPLVSGESGPMPLRPNRPWAKWLPKLAIGSGVLLVGGFGLLQWWQTSLLNELQSLKSQSQFEQCIFRANSVPAFLPAYPEAQTLLNTCRLALGKQFALDRQHAKAIAVVTPIKSNDPSYAEAQRFIKEWSTLIQLQNEQNVVDFCQVPNSVIFNCPTTP